MLEDSLRASGDWPDGKVITDHDDEVIVVSFIRMILDQITDLEWQGDAPNPLDCVHQQRGMCGECGQVVSGLLLHSPLGAFQMLVLKQGVHYAGSDDNSRPIELLFESDPEDGT